jgi:hypothetical protein
VKGIAHLYTDLRGRAQEHRIVPLPGRSLLLCSSSAALITAAGRALNGSDAANAVNESGTAPRDICVVEHYSDAGFTVDALGRLPSRSFQHPTMGIFHVFDLNDGMAVVQPGRNALLCADSGELVWLIEERLLASGNESWPNLLDLGMVVISEALRRSGYFLAHAGAVGRKGRCLLLTGESGAGKTTLVLKKVLEGWDFYGDDMVIIGRGDEWQVHPFWRPVHLTPHTIRLLGAVEVGSAPFTHENKMQCDIRDLTQARRPAPGAIEAVLCLRASWTPHSLERIPETEAIAMLGAAFLSGFNLRKPAALENLLDFVASIPVYQGSWSANPKTLDTLLDGANAYAENAQNR